MDSFCIKLRVYRTDYPIVHKLCRKYGSSSRKIYELGVYWRFRSLLSRPVLLAGILAVFLLTLFIPTRVMFIRLEGNSCVSDQLLLWEAEKCGITFGASRKEMRSEKIKNELINAIPDLKWVGINTVGCTAIISIREREEVGSGEQNKTGIRSIIASNDGVVSEITVTRGSPLCEPGTAVRKGETLISGYIDCGTHLIVTQAEGEIYAQTSRQLHALMPRRVMQRTTVVNRQKRYAVIIGKKRLNFYFGSGICDSECDRMYDEIKLTLPGGFALPVSFISEVTNGYSLKPSDVSEERAAEELRRFSDGYLKTQMISGSVADCQADLKRDSLYYQLSGQFLCREMIGRYQWEQTGETNGKKH